MNSLTMKIPIRLAIRRFIAGRRSLFSVLTVAGLVTAATVISFSSAETPSELNRDIKMVQELIARKENMLIYGIDHAVLAVEARNFAETVRWHKLSSDSECDYFQGADLALPTS